MKGLNLSDDGIQGRQIDIRTADLERGVWIVVIPEKDSQWVAHVWRKGKEVINNHQEAEELCFFLREKGHNALALKIAPGIASKEA